MTTRVMAFDGTTGRSAIAENGRTFVVCDPNHCDSAICAGCAPTEGATNVPMAAAKTIKETIH